MKRILLILIALALVFPAAFATSNLVVDSVNYTPSPAIPGQYLELWAHLKNNSTYTAENAVFQLNLKDLFKAGTNFPFSLESGDSAIQNLGKIAPYQTVTVKYKIRVEPNALNGDYTFDLIYGEEGRLEGKYQLTVKVLNRKPDLEITNVIPDSIAPGQSAELELVIENIGTEKATGVVVGVNEDRTVTSTGVVVERNIIPVGAAVVSVGDIDAGKTEKIKIRVGANPGAELKIYTVPITMRYRDSNGTTLTETAYIGLKVSQEAELDAVVSGEEPLAMPGVVSELKIDLFNGGVGSAQYLVVEISSEAGEFETTKNFIGTLEADDFDSFKAKIKLKGDVQPGMQPLHLKFSYKNKFGEPKIVEKDLMFKVYSAGEVQALAGQGPDIWFYIVILIVLFFAGRFAYRRFIKKKK